MKGTQPDSRSVATAESAGKAPKWTVMVFMGAGHVEGEAAALDRHAVDDLEEMRLVGSDGPDGSLNIFAQVHGLGDPMRGWIGHKPWERVPEADGIPNDGRALIQFIEWSLVSAQHGPADHSLLVLWGHAYQFAIGHDLTRTGVDALDFGELGAVLKKFQDKLKGRWPEAYGETASPRLSVVGFDACDVSTIEVANQLSPFADYLVSSQIGIPLPGWPYDTILERLKSSRENVAMSPQDFGAFAVRKFCEEYHETGPDDQPLAVSLTLLDLRKSQDVFDAAERLAQQLALAGGDDAAELGGIENQFFQSQTLGGKPFIDVADFCVNLSRSSGDTKVRAAAAALGDILIRPTTNGDRYTPRGSFIVEHARNSHQTAKLHGVSLYAPQVAADTQDWRLSRFWYNKFALAKESAWSRLVHVLAEGS